MECFQNITEFQRYKETADDYRYMPEPDIPVIEISNEDIKNISKELVELPNEKIKRYISDWGITEYSAEVISSTKRAQISLKIYNLFSQKDW